MTTAGVCMYLLYCVSEADCYIAHKWRSERNHVAVRISSDLAQAATEVDLKQAEREQRGKSQPPGHELPATRNEEAKIIQ